jgi:hypothetical protein
MKSTSFLFAWIIARIIPDVSPNDHAHTRGYQENVESQEIIVQLSKIDQVREQLAEKLLMARDNDDNSPRGEVPRELQVCDECGTQGSCGRTTKLKEFFSVTVEDSSPGGLFTATCEYANMDAPNCYYAVNASTPSFALYHGMEDLADALADHANCVNFIYPRSIRTTSKGYTDKYCDASSLCLMIENICKFKSITSRSFRCPVGTFMTIAGGHGPTKLKVQNDTVIINAGDNCVIDRTHHKVDCQLADGVSMAATLAADNCNCVTCGQGNNIQVHECSNPIPSWIAHSGVCAPDTAESNFCKPGFTRVEINQQMLAVIADLRTSLKQVSRQVLIRIPTEASSLIQHVNAAIVDLDELEENVRSNRDA